MDARIETLGEKKFVGLRMTVSVANGKTGELWRAFMGRRAEVQGAIGTELYSMQAYGPSYFSQFNPTTEFEKWAAVEVANFDSIPDGMEAITLPAGLYAVFLHRGGPSTGPQTFSYIFGTWLPNSPYTLDNRLHFEVLGDKYKNNHPDSEEEIWVPIKPKNGAE